VAVKGLFFGASVRLFGISVRRFGSSVLLFAAAVRRFVGLFGCLLAVVVGDDALDRGASFHRNRSLVSLSLSRPRLSELLRLLLLLLLKDCFFEEVGFQKLLQ
jgi:hypothetical protein